MRLDLTNIDLTKKENQTFRNWFALQWQNNYILTFAIGVAFFIGMATSLTGSALWTLLIPAAIVGVTVYKGFYQFWDDMKKGISR